jgi:hypothetical protein
MGGKGGYGDQHKKQRPTSSNSPLKIISKEYLKMVEENLKST